MGARYDQKFGRLQKWLHSDALRRAYDDLTYLTFCLIFFHLLPQIVQICGSFLTTWAIKQSDRAFLGHHICVVRYLHSAWHVTEMRRQYSQRVCSLCHWLKNEGRSPRRASPCTGLSLGVCTNIVIYYIWCAVVWARDYIGRLRSIWSLVWATGRSSDTARFATFPTTDNLHAKQHACNHEKLP